MVFQASPDTQEYLCEIQSYKFWMEGGEYLDAAAVDLIEKAGFVWPTNQANFVRWFRASSPADIQEMAAFALAALHSLFHSSSVNALDVKSYIPPIEQPQEAKPKFALFSPNVTAAEIMKKLGIPVRRN